MMTKATELTAARQRRRGRLRRNQHGGRMLVLVLLSILTVTTRTRTITIVDAFSSVSRRSNRSGGRSPSQPDKTGQDSSSDQQQHQQQQPKWKPRPSEANECRLVVCQITDVYTLGHFASIKTLLKECREQSTGATTISMLTGDFLSPYLLSGIDRGAGMMNALIKTPIDYLTWGNHEADISHTAVCKHVRNYASNGGKWINSNMLDHATMDVQLEYDVITLTSPDGKQSRKVGLVAVLSDDPALYKHFKEPGAFGGATITNPWKALEKYQKILKEEEGCDLVIPLQHLYVPDDHKTCREFDFPVVLSGHDHHRVDEVVDGTRLLKPGMNSEHAAMVEISWPSSSTDSDDPTIVAQFVKTDQWEPDPELEEENERAYDALIPLRNTEIARVPQYFEPLSSNNSRGSVCTMGRFICSLIKSSLNVSRRQRDHAVDAVLLMGGNIRGNADYPIGSFFSLEALEAEIKSDEVIGVLPMPGWVLAAGIEETHAGDPIPGWMQYDIGIQQQGSSDNDDEGVGHPNKVTHVAGRPIDTDKVYNVATKIGDITNSQSETWTKYYTENSHLLPPKGAYVNIQSELMSYFARNLWRKLWDKVTEEIGEICDVENDCNPDGRLKTLDRDGTGEVTIQDIQTALRELLDYSVDSREETLASFVHSFADTTGDGTVTLDDFEAFCTEMEKLKENDSWRIAFDKSITASLDTITT
mmetsp:Transcript_23849/g.56313  ORF Transcript_23849/g.56313 Transcript_23849/m.56313 type:complete len:702 (-) Transcript_23849:83-2188(-)